jgi:hypothetical protein
MKEIITIVDKDIRKYNNILLYVPSIQTIEENLKESD